jgi:hypothetical protein
MDPVSASTSPFSSTSPKNSVHGPNPIVNPRKAVSSAISGERRRFAVEGACSSRITFRPWSHLLGNHCLELNGRVP